MSKPNWKIMIADDLDDQGKEILGSAAFVSDRAGIAASDLIKIIPEFDALIVRSRTKVNADLLDAASKLKVVGRSGVGTDNIDLSSAKSHQVIVVNTPTASSTAVAELTLGLLLSLARLIPQANASVKNGQWKKSDLVGIEIFGKTLGIIGLGNIGRQVAKRATGMGMNVLAFDILPSSINQHLDGVKPVTLGELYRSSDFISLHIPRSKETRGLLDARAFNQMRPGVRIISTARGGIIDEEALLEGLRSGHIAGAALDVFNQEPPGVTDLVEHPNVIVTPHIGAQTVETQSKASEQIATEVLAALRGEPLRWQVV